MLFEQKELFSKTYWQTAVIICLIMTGLLCILPLVALRLPDEISYPFSSHDHVSTDRLKQEFVGWREVSATARQMRDEMNSENQTVIMAKNWHLASMLAFYSGYPTEVFAFEEGNAHNFDIWRNQRGGLKGYDAVMIVKQSKVDKHYSSMRKKYKKHHKYLDKLFQRVVEAPSLIINKDGSAEKYLGFDTNDQRLREFLVLRCYGYSGQLKK